MRGSQSVSERGGLVRGVGGKSLTPLSDPPSIVAPAASVCPTSSHQWLTFPSRTNHERGALSKPFPALTRDRPVQPCHACLGWIRRWNPNQTATRQPPVMLADYYKSVCIPELESTRLLQLLGSFYRTLDQSRPYQSRQSRDAAGNPYHVCTCFSCSSNHSSKFFIGKN